MPCILCRYYFWRVINGLSLQEVLTHFQILARAPPSFLALFQLAIEDLEMSGISSSSKEAGEANGAPGTGKSALQSATEFAETVFTPEKWEWLNKLKDQVSEDRGENGGKSAEESSQQQKLDSQPSLTENLFLPEKWEWVVKLNEMTMSDEARRVNNKMKAE